MSEYHVVETEFKDKECLIGALEEMGFKPLVHDKPQQLEGFQGDKRQQRAHIILPRRQVGGSSNDVGFEKVGDNYITHASEFDRAWRTGKKINELKQKYGVKVIEKTIARHSRYSLRSKKVDEEGNIKIRVRRL